MLSPPSSVPPPSDKLTVTVAAPFALAAVVKLSVPDELITGWLLKSELLSLVNVKVTL